MRGSRRLRLTLVLLLLTAFTLTALDYNTAQNGPLAALRRGIDTVFGPLEGVVGGGASSVGNALSGLPRLGSYQSDNKKLQQENARLNGTIASMAGLQCQVDQLNQLMHFIKFTDYHPVPAHVVAVGPAGAFEWTATIDAGSADGIKAGMSVVTGAGLVGRTNGVTPHTATVLLLADPKFTVGGTLISQASVGFATGNGSKPMTYSLASTRSVVRKGDVLLTTGSDTYAPGVPIGTVTSITPDTNAISRTATIVPFVDVSSLDLVGVITTKTPTAPRVPFRPYGPGPSPTSSPCRAAVPQGPVPAASPTPRVTVAPRPSGSSTPSGSVTPSGSATPGGPVATATRTP
ncbi:MAG: Rod shape-determining protein MreC [Frankiales bacterium]|nr:Rod shape-determining protein MreC [Frankiales bacterium]